MTRSPLDAAMTAINQTLREHAWDGIYADRLYCGCGWESERFDDMVEGAPFFAHQAEQVRATVAGLPPDQLAALIGGTVKAELGGLGAPDRFGVMRRPSGARVIGPWVPNNSRQA